MIKNIDSQEIVEKLKVGAVALAIFLVGFGTGRSYSNKQKTLSPKLDYTTNGTSQQLRNLDETGNRANLAKANDDCKVKGNIGNNNKKVYHVRGGQYYSTVKYEMCFKDEVEAKTSGFKKSSR